MIKLIAALVAALTLTSAAVAGSGSRVTVAMHDPGCHAFLISGHYRTVLTTKAPVSLTNMDEATLVIKGTHSLRDKVGSTVKLGRGVYHITMVNQAPDDNHLVLTVK